MRKLIITCKCGQRMRVPRTAVGKVGLCPTCGERVPITPDNANLQPDTRDNAYLRRESIRNRKQGRAGVTASVEQRFGKAVDLFYEQHYAEALSLFNALLQECPGNPEITAGREECMRQMKKRALGDGGTKGFLPGGTAELSLDLVKQVVLDKLLNGTRPEVQLHAADLALHILDVEREMGAADTDETSGAQEESPEDATEEAGDEENSAPEEEEDKETPDTANEEAETEESVSKPD